MIAYQALSKQKLKEALGTRLHRVSAAWSAGLECWNGVLEWKLLEWSEALKWASDHFWESFKKFSKGGYEEGLGP